MGVEIQHAQESLPKVAHHGLETRPHTVPNTEYGETFQRSNERRELCLGWGGRSHGRGDGRRRAGEALQGTTAAFS